MSKISVVVPVFNEADSLTTLWGEINDVALANSYDLEVIFVDDGSKDDSWKVMSGLAERESSVCAIRLRRNFGKAAALRAGIKQSDGDFVVTMDADLQDDPAGIPEMVAALTDDVDLVSGWKKVRHDPIGKRLPSWFFNRLVSWMTGVSLHDHNCGFKIYRREIFDEVKLYGEMHRFVPVLAAARGYRVGELVVNHRAREHGVSKYGWSRLPKGFLDLLTVSFLTGFNQRPQHILGSIGLGSFALGLLGMMCMAVYWVLRMTAFGDWTPLHQRPIVIYSLGALIVGVQLLCIGFLAELFIARGMQQKEPYSISDQIPPGNRPVAGRVSGNSETDRESSRNEAV